MPRYLPPDKSMMKKSDEKGRGWHELRLVSLFQSALNAVKEVGDASLDVDRSSKISHRWARSTS